jgi:hypothetical protein
LSAIVTVNAESAPHAAVGVTLYVAETTDEVVFVKVPVTAVLPVAPDPPPEKPEPVGMAHE